MMATLILGGVAVVAAGVGGLLLQLAGPQEGEEPESTQWRQATGREVIFQLHLMTGGYPRLCACWQLLMLQGAVGWS